MADAPGFSHGMMYGLAAAGADSPALACRGHELSWLVQCPALLMLCGEQEHLQQSWRVCLSWCCGASEWFYGAREVAVSLLSRA
jgi:hypothetical protein